MKLAFIMGLVCAALSMVGSIVGVFVAVGLGAGIYVAAGVVGIMALLIFVSNLD